MQFSQPPSQARFLKPAEVNGHLILVTQYIGIERVIDKFRGECDQLEVELVDLDGDKKAERYLIKHPSIIKAIQKTGYTLGRIGQRTSQSTGNQYWTVLPFEEGDDTKAEQWAVANQIRPAAQPAPAAASPVAGRPLTLDDMRTVNAERDARLAAVSAGTQGDQPPPF
jgi:hypothetical protein